MRNDLIGVQTASTRVLETNKVIRNTYMLLSLTVLFSALTALISMQMNLMMPIWLVLIGYFGLLYLTSATANSAMGLVSVFAFTGFMGLTLGPILNMTIEGFSNGSELIAASLGATGAIFFALSGYAMTTRKDFSYLAGFLFVAVTVVVLASIVGIFFPSVPALQLTISAAMVLLMGGYILFETSQLVNGGQTNYILATVSLYVTLFNLFVNLLRLLSVFAGRRE